MDAEGGGKRTAGARAMAWNFLRSVPFPIALLTLTLVLGLASGMDDERLTAALNKGFGLNIGYFALLLFSSFLLAEAISLEGGASLGALAPVLAPMAGAGMLCCDTAYAALSPLAGPRRKQVAVGAYAGFKLLIPAGPLIIGSSLGADTGDPLFIALGIGLAIVATCAGLLCLGAARRRAAGAGPVEPPRPAPDSPTADNRGEARWARRAAAPFLLLASLIVAGFVLDLSRAPTLKFLCAPIGALAASALLAFAAAGPERRGKAARAALERAASLVFVIGSATSLGTMLGSLVPLGPLMSAFSSRTGTVALSAACFALAAVFKILNGSSMATFAAVPPLVSPIVAASALDPRTATYALCLGAFVAVLPNDSFFWITQPAGEGKGAAKPDFSMTWVSAAQGLSGFAVLIVLSIVAR